METIPPDPPWIWRGTVIALFLAIAALGGWLAGSALDQQQHDQHDGGDDEHRARVAREA